MSIAVRAGRPPDHPGRERADHANLEPRRQVKHPEVSVPQRRGKKVPALRKAAALASR